MKEKIENAIAEKIFMSNKCGILSDSVFEKFLDFWDNVILNRAITEHNEEMQKLKGVKVSEF